MTMAEREQEAPKSTWTHWTPFLNSTASSSVGSLRPSVIWASVPVKGWTLAVTGLPRAMFVTPLGTINGGTLSEIGSMFEPLGRSSGVPRRVGEGNFRASGTFSAAAESPAKTGAGMPDKRNAAAIGVIRAVFKRWLSFIVRELR